MPVVVAPCYGVDVPETALPRNLRGPTTPAVIDFRRSRHYLCN
jgi:hypothetical protein